MPTGSNFNFMNAAIFRVGLPGDKVEPVENFKFDIDTDKLETVKKRLKELCSGYCAEGETPRVKLQDYNDKGKVVRTISAYCSADYSYIAYLAVKIKTLPS